jgi:hypothetical protein
MKTITCNYQINFNLPINKDDLIWVSCIQNPFGIENNHLINEYGVWEIPCELCRVDEVYFDDNGVIWGMSIFDKNNKIESVGIHISDIIENHTYNIWSQKMFKSYHIIASQYKVRYTIRKIMANRIKRQYIQYYWNPKNPNMQQRLMDTYHELISV